MSNQPQISYPGIELESMALAVNYARWIRDRLKPFLGKHIVEVGAGMGSFSQLLIETEPEALTLLEPSMNLYSVLVKKLPELDKRGIAEALPFSLEGFLQSCSPHQTDTVVYINVLEHIEDDHKELKTALRVLTPGGRLLIFVPANRWLLGSMDRQLGHLRRYSCLELESKCRSAGFNICFSAYFDFIGMIPWWLKYCVLKSNRMEPGAVMFYDRWVVPFTRALEHVIPPPLGKSIVLAAEKPR